MSGKLKKCEDFRVRYNGRLSGRCLTLDEEKVKVKSSRWKTSCFILKGILGNHLRPVLSIHSPMMNISVDLNICICVFFII